jgi:hypothetical protein
MSNDCHRFRDQIADFVTGVLPEPDSRQLQEHLSTCALCRDYLQALKQEDASLMEYFTGIDEDMAHRQERALQMVECPHRKEKTDPVSIWRGITKNRYSKLATAAAILVVTGISIILLDGTTSPAYAINQTVEAFKSIRFLHVVERNGADVIENERWVEVGPDGGQARYRQDKPPHIFVIDDGKSIARYHSYTNTMTIYHSREMQYEWIRPLGRAFENLLQEGMILEENAAFRGRRVHKVWWPAMRGVCYVDPQTRLPVAIEDLELSYEEPPAGTFKIVVPEGYAIVDDTQQSDFYAAVELIQPATPLMEIVNRDEVIRLHRTGPRSYVGDLDLEVTCNTDVTWTLSVTKTGVVQGDYSCSIDKWDIAPPGGVATVAVALTQVQAENTPRGTQVALVTLRVEPRPDPMNDARALRELGLALYDAKRYEEALTTFERIEQQDNADQEELAMAIIWQGHVLDLLGRRNEAIARYERVVGMGLEGGVHQGQYGLRYEFTPYAKERMTTPFTRMERLDSK